MPSFSCAVVTVYSEGQMLALHIQTENLLSAPHPTSMLRTDFDITGNLQVTVICNFLQSAKNIRWELINN